MKKQYIILSLLLVLIVSAFGCGKKKDKTPDIPLWSIDNEGYTRFFTKNTADYGWDYWAWNSAIIKNPMNYVETSVKKVSGNHDYGYGIIFCVQDSQNFYRLLIDIDGYYSVHKIVKDEWSSIIGWMPSIYLEPGYNKLNKIKVEYNSESKDFTVYFNDKFANNFTDDSFTGGSFGFFAGVGEKDKENFPKYPVDVRFKQHYPTKDTTDKSSIMTEKHILIVSSSLNSK